MEIMFPEKQSCAISVLVIHSWWGLTSSFRDFGADLASQGICTGLADLFDGKTANSPKQAKALRQAPRSMPMYRQLIADLDELREASGPAAKMAVAGFSMGGHWAVWLSQQPDLAIRSTVLYYAARGGDFSKSRSSYLAHFAVDDPWIKPQTRKGMEKAIHAANLDYHAHEYPGAGHWFAESNCPQAYDRAAYELAFQRTLQHLHATAAR